MHCKEVSLPLPTPECIGEPNGLIKGTGAQLIPSTARAGKPNNKYKLMDRVSSLPMAVPARRG